MPIHAITGMPGNGKTAIMMEMLLKQAKSANRPIFHAGIAGIKHGLGTELKDPTQWNAHDPNQEGTCDCHGDGILHSHIVPDGSIIFIDESWKWFGHLHDATKQATPKHVLALAEHRHRGIDFVWTFQSPNQVYPFSRGLIQDHWHCLRKHGTKAIDVYKWNEFQESVKSNSIRSAAFKDTRLLPSMDVLESYKSASDHTIKMKLPWRIWLIPIGILIAILCLFYLYRYLSPKNTSERMQNATGATLSSAADKGDSGNITRPVETLYKTAKEYLDLEKPLLPSKPWTAPIFSKREIVSNPEIYCIYGEPFDNQPASCTCITEQGTKYALQLNQCKILATNGQYNPYRQKIEQLNNQLPTQVATNFQSSDTKTLTGTTSPPNEVGSPNQGKVW